MKYELMQIHLSDSEIMEINRSNDHSAIPKAKMKIAMQMDFSGVKASHIASEAYSKGFYDHVSNIEANDLDEVYEIGNIGPEDAIERLGRMHSVSVGDIIIDEEGNKFLVASFGFKEVA